MTILIGSVGFRGKNMTQDVIAVQKLLLAHKCNPKGIDGRSGINTITAIKQFQAQFMRQPDGLIDANGATWKRLNKTTAVSPAVAVIITYGSNANQAALTNYAISTLKEVCAKAGISSVRISSTARSVEDQARIMYENIQTHGVSQQKSLYAAPGRAVIDAYEQAKVQELGAAQIKEKMAQKIRDLGPGNVSKHLVQGNGRITFDVAPSSLTPNTAQSRQRFVIEAKAHAKVLKFLEPPLDPAYHLEVGP